MSPDGEKMLTVCDNGYVYIYQISDYQLIKELKGTVQFFSRGGTHTHTHTHIYIYIYVKKMKKRELT